MKTSNQTNGYHSTIVQVNNERNLATAPLKEKQTNASDLIIQPTQVISNGSESKPIKFNGTSTTISVNAPPKVQQNGVNRPASEPVTNGNTNGTTNNNTNGKPPTNCVSNGVAKKETTKSTVKTQQSGSSSSNESSLSSIDSNETAVIGEVDRAPSSQSRTSNEDGEKCCNRWFKEAVLLASNFEDGRYVLSVSDSHRFEFLIAIKKLMLHPIEATEHSPTNRILKPNPLSSSGNRSDPIIVSPLRVDPSSESSA